MSVDDLAEASCVVYVDDRRAGTGTLVTSSYVLTAAHVVRRDGPVTVKFLNGPSGEAIPVERLPLGSAAGQLDIAVLELVPGPGDQPPPAKLWPAKRLPPETKAFGYPLADNPPRGVWRDSRVSGAVQGGRAQLDWDEVGTLAGHSGGPVCDKRTGLMAGVLVEGAETWSFRPDGHPSRRENGMGRAAPSVAVRRGERTDTSSPSGRQASRASPAAVICSEGGARRLMSWATGSAQTLGPGSHW